LRPKFVQPAYCGLRDMVIEIDTLQRGATFVGRKLRLELV